MPFKRLGALLAMAAFLALAFASGPLSIRPIYRIPYELYGVASSWVFITSVVKALRETPEDVGIALNLVDESSKFVTAAIYRGGRRKFELINNHMLLKKVKDYGKLINGDKKYIFISDYIDEGMYLAKKPARTSRAVFIQDAEDIKKNGYIVYNGLDPIQHMKLYVNWATLNAVKPLRLVGRPLRFAYRIAPDEPGRPECSIKSIAVFHMGDGESLWLDPRPTGLNGSPSLPGGNSPGVEGEAGFVEAGPDGALFEVDVPRALDNRDNMQITIAVENPSGIPTKDTTCSYWLREVSFEPAEEPTSSPAQGRAEEPEGAPAADPAGPGDLKASTGS
jgi:hypothetical protein